MYPSFFFCQVKQEMSGNIDTHFQNNVKIEKEAILDHAVLYSLRLKSHSVSDDMDVSGNLELFSSSPPSVDRIVEPKKNAMYVVPSFYSMDLQNDTLVISKETFINLDKYFKVNLLTSKTVFDRQELLDKAKGYNIYEQKIKNIHFIHLKMTVGFYNKYNHGMDIIGDFDKIVNVIYLID